MPDDSRSAVRPDWTPFPSGDFTRVPFSLYVDREVYEEEQRRVFRGPVWSFVALEAEFPNAGDFKTTAVGDTPIIVQRGEDGKFAAFVNRCRHRGTTVRAECFGNAKSHTCAYHQWTYNTKGELISVPYRRGSQGKGGYSDEFKLSERPLIPLKVDSYQGLVFASFDHAVEPLPDYLGPTIRGQLDRLLENRPIRILGYNRQTVNANWKLYLENLKDPYHSGLLHYFLPAVMGTFRATMEGGMLMDRTGGHSVLFSREGTDDANESQAAYSSVDRFKARYTLTDPSVIERRPGEFGDNVENLAFIIFPNLAVQQILNTLAVRQIVTFPGAPETFELRWTYFAPEDDDEEMTEIRLKQSNMIGPAGLFSLEDGEALERLQRAIRPGSGFQTVELGGRGPIQDSDHLITEVAIRGMWQQYCRLMNYPIGG